MLNLAVERVAALPIQPSHTQRNHLRNGVEDYRMKDESIVGLPGANTTIARDNNASTTLNGAADDSSVASELAVVGQQARQECSTCFVLKREIAELRQAITSFLLKQNMGLISQSRQTDLARLTQQIGQLNDVSLQQIAGGNHPLLLQQVLNHLATNQPSSPTHKLLENLDPNRNSSQLPTLWSLNPQVQTNSSSVELGNTVNSINPNSTPIKNETNIIDQFMLMSPQAARQASQLNQQFGLTSNAAPSTNHSLNQLLSLAAQNPALYQALRNSLFLQQQQQQQQQQVQQQSQTQAQSTLSAQISTLPQLQHSLFLNQSLQTQQPREPIPQHQPAHPAPIPVQNTTNFLPAQVPDSNASTRAATQVITDRNVGDRRVSSAIAPLNTVLQMHSGFQRAASDDYVRIIRQHDLSAENIDKIPIPVPQAIQVDPGFRPLSEDQVVQQVMQNKKYEAVNVAETMAQLCKKLAEKRVFGSRLMAQTTVAAPNHSNYNNLPSSGIIYIQHVCRKVLGSRLETDEDFWECFREAMRKLAARCRRVRHAKKVRSPKMSDLVNQAAHFDLLQPHGGVGGLGLLKSEPDPLDVELHQSPDGAHTPLSSPSRNSSSTPTPSSSSKPDN